MSFYVYNKYLHLHIFYFLYKDNLCIFLITETKLDSSFRNARLHIPGYWGLIVTLMEVEFYYISEKIYLQNF